MSEVVALFAGDRVVALGAGGGFDAEEVVAAAVAVAGVVGGVTRR